MTVRAGRQRVRSVSAGLGVVILAFGLLAGGQASGEAKVIEGTGVVVAKNVRAGTVEVSLRTYEVGPGTVLEGLRGERITLAELPTAAEGTGPVAGGSPGLVRFRAIQRGERLRLLHLKVIPPVPN